MLVVNSEAANVEFTEKEYEILNNLTSEKVSDMGIRLSECDRHKYIEIVQLNAKLASILSMIDYEKKCRKAQNKKDGESEKNIAHTTLTKLMVDKNLLDDWPNGTIVIADDEEW